MSLRSGAYLGAYVRPPSGDTAAQRIAAVLAYEQQLGHRLGLVHLYHPWGSAFPDAADTLLRAAEERSC